MFLPSGGLAAIIVRLTAAPDEDRRSDPRAHQSHNAKGDQDSRPVELGGELVLRDCHRLEVRPLEDSHIPCPVQGDPADRPGVVRRYRVALEDVYKRQRLHQRR